MRRTAVVLVAVLVAGLLVPGSARGAAPVERLEGADRIATAVAISQRFWPNGATNVVLARADDFPDALAGGPLADLYRAPLLLTGTNALDPRVAAEIDRLDPDHVLLLGGPAALSDAVESAIPRRGPRTHRIHGANRYATAREIARTIDEFADAGADDAAVVTGENFPDALTAMNLLPTRILLSRLDRFDTYVGGYDYTLVGGPAVLGDAVASRTGGTRLFGGDRYGTAAAVLDTALAEGGPGPLFVATGSNFPDALAAGAAVARTNGYLLIIDPRHGPSADLEAVLTAHADAFTEIVALGGVQALPPGAVEVVEGLLEPTDPTEEPTEEPTDEPTEEPTDEPTDEPTEEPTEEPTDEPTEEPTDKPTDEPTEEPVGYGPPSALTALGGSSQATGVNDAGDVVGTARDADGRSAAVVWHGGGGSPGVLSCGTGWSAVALDVNASGQVSGTCEDVHAVLWTDATARFLDMWGYASTGEALNDDGVVVGTSDDESEGPRGHLWAPPDYTVALLVSLYVSDRGEGTSTASDINASNEIAGATLTADGLRAAVFSGEDVRLLARLPGHGHSRAVGINSDGTAVGHTTFAGALHHATLWIGEEVIDLGTLPGGSTSYALAVNDLGQVVGWSDGPDGNRAVLWDGGEIVDLGALPGSAYSAAADINDSGWIVGDSGGQAVLWTPGG